MNLQRAIDVIENKGGHVYVVEDISVFSYKIYGLYYEADRWYTRFTGYPDKVCEVDKLYEDGIIAYE